jgi:hypothetical protein
MRKIREYYRRQLALIKALGIRLMRKPVVKSKPPRLTEPPRL